MSAILYTVATDEQGVLIRANDAEKHNDYFCPVCKSSLILKKSGNTGKGAKRPHFAHRALTPNCTPESALHYGFKMLLADKIANNIASNSPLMISWECKWCGLRHSGNLLKKVKDVQIEHSLSACQPDIGLFDQQGTLFVVIEVVVTHKPEPAVLKFYDDNNIILVQVNLTSDKDIDDLDLKIANPDIVSTCYNPKCKKCGNFLTNKQMLIVTGSCWHCGEDLKIACITLSNNAPFDGFSTYQYPGDFTNDEIKFALSKGVILKEEFSRTADRSYLAHSCSHCKKFTGEHYLFTDFISMASYGDLPSEEFTVGYYCEDCEISYGIASKN